MKLSRIKQFTCIVMMMTVTLLIGGTALAQNDSDTVYTGCLIHNGKIFDVAEGNNPLKPCKSKDTQISWHSSGHVTDLPHPAFEGQFVQYVNDVWVAVSDVKANGEVTGTDVTATGTVKGTEVDATSAFTFNNEPILRSISDKSGTFPNLAVGEGALAAVNPDGVKGIANVGVGYNALHATKEGYENTAVGFKALVSNTTGYNNTAVGAGALADNFTGVSNTALGWKALAANTTGTQNVAVGENALQSSQVGGFNIGIGVSALEKITNGDGNVAVGYEALLALADPVADPDKKENNNVAIGRSALASLVSGDENVALGYFAGDELTAGTGNIYIGSGVLGEPAESNTTRIGVNQDRVFISGIANSIDNCDSAWTPGSISDCHTYPVRINLDGKLTMFTSSRRFKEDISELGDVSQKVLALRPVDFRRKGQSSREIRNREVGLIAEEVAVVFPQLALYDKDGKPLSVDFNAVAVVALNEVQRLHRLLEKQQSEIALLRAQLPAIAELAARLERLEASQLQLAAY